MSHFSELKTQLTDKGYLIKALQRMRFAVTDTLQPVKVYGFMGDTVEADFKVSTASVYEIGFKKNASGHFELVGDWEVLPKASGIQQDAFLQELKREYARAAIQDLAERGGFAVEEERLEDGSIEMVVSQ